MLLEFAQIACISRQSCASKRHNEFEGALQACTPWAPRTLMEGRLMMQSHTHITTTPAAQTTDRVYKGLTIAAMLLLLVSLWAF